MQVRKLGRNGHGQNGDDKISHVNANAQEAQSITVKDFTITQAGSAITAKEPWERGWLGSRGVSDKTTINNKHFY